MRYLYLKCSNNIKYCIHYLVEINYSNKFIYCSNKKSIKMAKVAPKQKKLDTSNLSLTFL